MRNANVAGSAGLTLIMGIGKVQKCPSTPLRLATQDDDYAYGKLREARSIRGGNPSEIHRAAVTWIPRLGWSFDKVAAGS